MTSQGIETFLSYLRETEQRYHMSEVNEQEANNETQDILHSLELQDHDYHDFARLSKELRGVRQKRRAAKDTMSETAPVLDWIDQNRPTIKSLERLLGDVLNAEKSTANRIYTPRTRRDSP